jgi:hypothetical protein
MEAVPEKTDAVETHLFKQFCRTIGIPEDEIAVLMREPAIDERTALNQGKPIRPR